MKKITINLKRYSRNKLDQNNILFVLFDVVKQYKEDIEVYIQFKNKNIKYLGTLRRDSTFLNFAIQSIAKKIEHIAEKKEFIYTKLIDQTKGEPLIDFEEYLENEKFNIN